MNEIKLFVGGTPEEASDAYKAWWDKQDGTVEIIGTPALEPKDTGWMVTIWFRPLVPRRDTTSPG